MIKSYLNFLFVCMGVYLLSSCTNEYENSELCFVGDSITELWDVESYFPEFAISKISKSGAKISDASNWNFEACRDKKTIVLIGTNDIGNTSIEEPGASAIRGNAITRYMNLLSKIPYESVIIVSLLPRDLHYKQDQSVNAFIASFNHDLKENVQMERAVYADVFDLFLDGDYKVRKYLFNDGLHPSPAGYELLSNELRSWL